MFDSEYFLNSSHCHRVDTNLFLNNIELLTLLINQTEIDYCFPFPFLFWYFRFKKIRPLGCLYFPCDGVLWRVQYISTETSQTRFWLQYRFRWLDLQIQEKKIEIFHQFRLQKVRVRNSESTKEMESSRDTKNLPVLDIFTHDPDRHRSSSLPTVPGWRLPWEISDRATQHSEQGGGQL